MTIACVICGITIILLISGFIFKQEKKTYELDSNAINSIAVDDKVNDVKVRTSPDDKIHVTYYQGKSTGYKIEKNGDALAIATTSNMINLTLGIQVEDSSLVIEIPKNYGKSLEITATKKCSVDKSIQFSSLDVESENED